MPRPMHEYGYVLQLLITHHDSFETMTMNHYKASLTGLVTTINHIQWSYYHTYTYTPSLRILDPDELYSGHRWSPWPRVPLAPGFAVRRRVWSSMNSLARPDGPGSAWRPWMRTLGLEVGVQLQAIRLLSPWLYTPLIIGLPKWWGPMADLLTTSGNDSGMATLGRWILDAITQRADPKRMSDYLTQQLYPLSIIIVYNH